MGVDTITWKYKCETDNSATINYHPFWLKKQNAKVLLSHWMTNELLTAEMQDEWTHSREHERTYEDPGLAVGGGPGKVTEEKQQDELRRGSEQEAFEKLLKDKSSIKWCWLWFM